MDAIDYDLDLFSPFIYKSYDSIFHKNKNGKYFFYPHRFFMIATAGTKFEIENSRLEDNNSLMSTILNSDLSFEPVPSPQLENILLKKYLSQDELNRNRSSYMRTFNEYAGKGLFSFDKTDINERENYLFHLVTYPKLNIEKYFILSEFVIKKLDIQISLDLSREMIGDYIDNLEKRIQQKKNGYGRRDMSNFTIIK